MIHILLLILKIIGIVLLALLATILLILFFPVTYSMNVRLEKNKAEGRLTAGWLFHIVHFGLRFRGDKVIYKLRVLGIPVFSSNKKEKEETKKKTTSQAPEKEEENKSENSKSNGHTVTEDNLTMNVSDIEDSREETVYYEKQQDVNSSDVQDAGIRAGKIEKIRNFIEKIRRKLKKLLITIKNAFRNIKETHNKINEVKKFITESTTKEAFNYGKTLIIKLLKHIFPRKIRANVQIGFEEPHVMGQVLGCIAMVYGTFGINPEHIVIDPYFDKKILQGYVKMRGRFLIGLVSYYALRFYFKKEINDIIKKFS